MNISGVNLEHKKSFFTVFVIWILISLACTFPTQAQTGLEPDLDSSIDYPDSPEGVVRAYLIAYQEGTDGIAQYVMGASSNTDAVGMLDINGMYMSFLIQAASVRPNPPGATIEVGVNFGEEEAVRVFNLTQQNGRWVIVSIEKLLN